MKVHAKCFKESLDNIMAFSARDWSVNSEDAWIYGIVAGWDKLSLQELQGLHGWNDEAIARLKKLHKQFVRSACHKEKERARNDKIC